MPSEDLLAISFFVVTGLVLAVRFYRAARVVRSARRHALETYKDPRDRANFVYGAKQVAPLVWRINAALGAIYLLTLIGWLQR